MPSEIIDAVFQAHADFHPVWVAVEEDGLNEFLLQPIRQRMVLSGVSLPLKAVRAPRGKLDFIRGLQPFFNAREVWFNGRQDDLERQLLSFPTGEIDAPNALAYALRLRPGAVVYEDFASRHVAEGLRPAAGVPMWLALGATGSSLTGVLCQVVDGQLRVFADYAREGDPGGQLQGVLQSAQMEAGRAVRLIAGPGHFDRYNNVGLVQAARSLPMEVRQGVSPIRGRAQIRAMMKRESRLGQGLQVDAQAHTVLAGLSAGLCFATGKGGSMAEEPEAGLYRTLIEGLESFVGLLDVMADEDDNRENLNYAYTSDGRRYVSALARR
jgi:hypothetical protein